MTYTLPTPAGKIFYPAEGDNEGDDAFDAEQVCAAYDKGLEDAAYLMEKSELSGLSGDRDLQVYTADQMRAAYERGLEDAAKLCDEVQVRRSGSVAEYCASAIRAMKGTL